MLQKIDRQSEETGENLFKDGVNCWRQEIAYHASLIVDYADYYRDLAESLMKAKHSIFITGWDIDSRIQLLREGTPDNPTTLYEILTLRARGNPNLQIYLNRWNYSFIMAGSREPMAVWRWRKAMLPNIHYIRDGMVPVGACHHQKIVIVDDEIAFMGGMDISFGRWDKRSHYPHNEKRTDPGGLYNPVSKVVFPAYHDIQTIVSGPAAKALAELSRERWRIAAGYDAVPMRKTRSQEKPDVWPESEEVDLEHISIAIARTIPKYANYTPAYEIEQIYLDEISRARKFIYFENQYFTRKNIAQALCRQLDENPDLRILMVSSYNPQGFFEKITMWVGRMKFKQILHRRHYKRVCMAYPISRGNGTKRPVRIHSKFMVVDDAFMHVGSANLNNRSMGMDTECDIIYQADTNKHKKTFEHLRNDLIREHTGMKTKDIQALIDQGRSPHEFMQVVPDSRQSLVKWRDGKFFSGSPSEIPYYIGDSEKGLIPGMPLPDDDTSRATLFPRKTIAALFLFLAASALMIWSRDVGWTENIGTDDGLKETLETIRQSPNALLTSIGLYILASYLFVPVTLLTAIVATVFGYWQSLFICATGAVASAILGYGTGRLIGRDKFRFFTGTTLERLKSQAKRSNIITMTFLRMIPVAPFSMVNIAIGILQMPFLVYFTGSILGLVPGKFITVFLADSLADVAIYQDHNKLLVAGAAFLGWIGLVWSVHRLHAWWNRKTAKRAV